MKLLSFEQPQAEGTDALVEKYLLGFVGYGKHQVDVYVNPTRKEIDHANTAEGGFKGRCRFIADGEKKQIYVWNSNLALHSDTWSHIAKQLHDTRKLYKDFELVSGEVLVPSMELDVYYVVDFGGQEMAKAINDIDWAWADKYIKGFDKKFSDAVKSEVERKGWSLE